MVIRRSGQRRRRVVIDEVANNRDEKNTDARAKTGTVSESNDKQDKSCEDSRLYSFGADRRGQRKTTDFVPKRFLSFACVVLVLVASIAILNMLAAYAPTWKSLVGNEGLRMMSITGVGSLSGWFSSFLLIVTGLASLQVYALRQHRCDDYRGTYRLWIWMAFLFVLASVHCVVDLGSVLGNVVYAVSQQPVGEKAWILITFKMVALTLLVVRGLFEVKESRGAFAMVVIVWLAYSSATVMQISPAKNSVVVDYQTAYGNLILLANTMLLLSILTYARYVFMQANGLKRPNVQKLEAPSRASKMWATVTAKAAKTKSTILDSEKTLQSVAETPEPPSKPKSRPPVPVPSRKVPPVPSPSAKSGNPKPSTESTRDDAQPILSLTPPQSGKMSKAERRRQRKLEKRQQRAA